MYFPSGSSQVHPRIRGEYQNGHTAAEAREGSPPHTRGILSNVLSQKQGTRFTPAYAGNTLCSDDFTYCLQVHPRIRGEYFSRSIQPPAGAGSPPHTRGILTLTRTESTKPRFTPAYAGNTEEPRLSSSLAEVHPRIRGEYAGAETPGRCAGGSPPHTRGIPMSARVIAVCLGFTPAYAGNTSFIKCLSAS